MQSIFTKYSEGKIIARASGGRHIRFQYQSALSSYGNHDAAALELCRRLGWKGKLARGSGARGQGNVYVFADDPRDMLEVK